MLKSTTSKLFSKIISGKVSRKIAAKAFDLYIKKRLISDNKTDIPSVARYKYMISKALVSCVLRNIDKGIIKLENTQRLMETLVDGGFNTIDHEAIARFKVKYGQKPPAFITLSPFAGCNLKCKDCYAASETCVKTQLDYKTVKKIVTEIHDVWGVRFVVISGGEPFMYNDNGKTIVDLFEDFPDIFFLIYTNATLITEDVAKRISKSGNVTPAISVEGYEKETDFRRGKGVYKILLSKFELLKKHGVPFGVSVTATRNNAELLTKDEFYDYYFQKVGVSYLWIFQYMPIGRGINPKMMITPQQRLAMLREWQHVLKDKEYFVADFWNSGVVSNGCIAYGKEGGYVYIDWNGNIMPCVFVPYYIDNIKDLYSKGKTLTDAIMSPMMKRGRKWQEQYKADKDNWLMPCSIRDHYQMFRKEIGMGAKPSDINAKEAQESKEYYDQMSKYDDEYDALTKKIWKEEFLEH